MSHLRSLTALRFGAALLVFLFHATAGSDVSPFSAGFVGVTFFFVLSGFVLTWAYSPDTSVPQFYWRRFARVWPLHALVTVLVVAVGLESAGGGSLAANLTLVRGVGADEMLNPPSWSLSTEAFFYLAFPALMVALAAMRRLRVAAIGAVAGSAVLGLVIGSAVQPGQLETWTYLFPPVRLGEFVLGMTLAVAMKRGWRPPSLAATGVGALFAYAVVWNLEPNEWVGALAMGPAFAFLIASCAHRDIDRSWAVPEFAVHLGKWSFAFYLVHWPVLLLVERSGIEGLAEFLLAGALTLAVAAVLHIWFERPVERWLRSLGARPLPAPAPARP